MALRVSEIDGAALLVGDGVGCTDGDAETEGEEKHDDGIWAAEEYVSTQLTPGMFVPCSTICVSEAARQGDSILAGSELIGLLPRLSVSRLHRSAMSAGGRTVSCILLR